MGQTRALSPEIQNVLRAATVSDDGLTLTLSGELDRTVFQATAKAIEALGGKWNRRVGAHLFRDDVRPVLAGVLDGEKLPPKNPLNFFPTPEFLARQMTNSLIPTFDGQRALEPSAGDGVIAEVLRELGYAVDVLELDDDRYGHLMAAGFNGVGRDFRHFRPARQYRAIAMNPPFALDGDSQAYITHIERAWEHCLAPNGVLVAIAPSGFTFRDDVRAAGFRALVETHGEWAMNPREAFRESGTEVQTVTVYLRKPLEADMIQTTEQPKKPSKSKKPEAAEPMDPREMAQLTREKMNPVREKAAPESESPVPVTEAQAEAVISIASGTLGLHAVPLAQLVRSGCNVRRHYDPAAIEELSASLKAEGQIENATGRWNDQGQIEIVAGESRRRAQVLREEAGELDLTLLVNVRELTDAEALSISATENMRRRNMTALEECEAMLRLTEAGRTVEDLAAMFGYKTQQPVVDRVLVAKNLHTQGRDLLDAGALSLSCAFVIARAPGEGLQKSLTQNAQRGHPASSLARFLTDGQFLVKNAKFNIEKSGLEVKRDMFDTFEPYFADKGKALNAQLEWANAQAEKARAKGKHPFVTVESGESAYAVLSGRKYVHSYSNTGNGLIYFVSTVHGEVTTENRYKLKASAVEAAKASGTASPDAVTREMPASAYDAAHVHRARALRHRLLGDSHRTLVLTVHALIVGTSGSTGRAAVRPSDAWQGQEITDEAVARIQTWQATLSAALGMTPTLVNQGGEVFHGADHSLCLYDYLFTLDTPELLNLLNVLVASRLYEPHYTESKRPAAPLYARLAAEVDADAYLAETFILTDEWLRRYPRQELVALAEEAGLGRALVEDAKTQKEMRGRIMEHAGKLHAEGFVPKMVRFPGPPAAADHSERDALRVRAAPIIAGLDQAGLDAACVSIELDGTDWDSLDECRASLHAEMLSMDVDELREWTVLWEAAQ